jgi:hypothetical protein
MWPRSSPGGPHEAWVQSTTPVSRPRDQKGVLGMEVAMDHRLTLHGGHRADGSGCLLPDACVGQPARWRRLSPVVIEPVRRELSDERAAGVVNDGQGLGKIRQNRLAAMSAAVRGCPGRRVRSRVGTSHSSPSMPAPTGTGAGTGVACSSSGSSSPGLRCSRGRRRPSPDAPTGATPDDGPGRPVDHSQRVVQMPAAPLVVVARPECGFPAPSCGRPRPRGFSGVRLLPVPRYPSRPAALGIR